MHTGDNDTGEGQPDARESSGAGLRQCLECQGQVESCGPTGPRGMEGWPSSSLAKERRGPGGGSLTRCAQQERKPAVCVPQLERVGLRASLCHELKPDPKGPFLGCQRIGTACGGKGDAAEGFSAGE